MKKNSIFLLTILFLLQNSSFLFAQERNQNGVDVALGFGSGISPAISGFSLHGVGKNGRFKIGLGGRLTTFSGKNMDFITAPAKLTSGQKGPQVLFSETIQENLDTLSLPKTGVVYLNIPIYLQYSFGERFDVGFNIDAIGLSFGGKQTGTFYASNSASLNKTQQTGSPTNFNLLLVSDNDLGSLNSELYARYWLTEKIGLRLGASFQFIEYTTNNTLTLENDRFRAKILQPMVAVSIKL